MKFAAVVGLALTIGSVASAGSVRAESDAGTAPPVAAELDVMRTDAGFAVEAPPAADAGHPLALIVQPPVLLADSPAHYPDALAGSGVAGEVKLQILVDETGAVAEATVEQGVDPLLDDAALHAAAGLRFEPASTGGKPIPVRIGFSYLFVAPAVRPADAASATLQGVVRAKGLRKPVPGAAVECGGVTTTTDSEGRFELEAPAGHCVAHASAPGYRPAGFDEDLRDGDRVDVVYLIEPIRANPYETIVRADRERTEVSRMSLREQEIRDIPGTMGDPFRVVMLLPGVSSVISGLPYPIVRGSGPAATGYFIDGIRVPILFHMMLGPAVVHPDFLDGMDFFAGAPPPQYGRLLGGVIEGKVSKPHEDRARANAYVDLINAGAFVEYPFEKTNTSVSAAGRISYTAWLIDLAVDALDEQGDATLDFWDYQLRVEQPVGRGKLRLLTFGSHDYIGFESTYSGYEYGGPREPGGLEQPTQQHYESSSQFGEFVRFHRADLRYARPLEVGELELGATLGLDQLGTESIEKNSLYGGREERFELGERAWGLRAKWRIPLEERLELTLGGDIDQRRAYVEITQDTGNGLEDAAPEEFALPVAIGTMSGVYGHMVWKSPEKRWTVAPGFRLDNYHLVPGVNHAVAEPRLTVRHQLTDRWALKGAAGLYHQAPVTLVQLPVLSVAGLQFGLQQGAQFDVGAEWRSPQGFEVVADVFVNPLLRTLELGLSGGAPIDNSGGGDIAEPMPADGDSSKPPPPARAAPEQEFVDDLTSKGYAYGFELLIRKPLGGNWFGWVSYTFSRSTRWTRYLLYDEYGEATGEAAGYLPFVFDQTHVLNAVLSYQLANRWTVGVVLHVNSGRPETGHMTSLTQRAGTDRNGRPQWIPVSEDDADRLPWFWRVDFRMARSFVYDEFTMELYLDVLNVAARTEVVTYTYNYDYSSGMTPKLGERTPEGIPLLIPMLGLRGKY